MSEEREVMGFIPLPGPSPWPEGVDPPFPWPENPDEVFDAQEIPSEGSEVGLRPIQLSDADEPDRRNLGPIALIAIGAASGVISAVIVEGGKAILKEPTPNPPPTVYDPNTGTTYTFDGKGNYTPVGGVKRI